MPRIGAAHDIRCVDATRLFLPDALKNSFGSRTLNTDGDTGVFCLERPADFFRGREFQRRIEADPAFFARRVDQSWCNCTRRRCGGPKRFGKHSAGRKSRRCLEQVAPGKSPVLHCTRSQ
jgi:hypothetical protein